MEKEVLRNYRKAQKISDQIIPFAKSLVKEGSLIMDIAEKIEEKIRRLGGKPAFPVNISINEHAAHYTPDLSDSIALKALDLVKIDVGVHVRGYIWDRAFTVCVGEKSHPLIETAEKALKEALKLLKPGAKICEVSEVIENTICEAGFNPVRNLCGHGLQPYNQHAYPSIPNGKNTILDEIKKDQLIAMEVFTTDGGGWVKETSPTLIYQFLQIKPVRLVEARRILKLAQTEFKKLPFTKRWLAKIIPPLKMEMALRHLCDIDALKSYPVLREINNGKVAQAEDTKIIK